MLNLPFFLLAYREFDELFVYSDRYFVYDILHNTIYARVLYAASRCPHTRHKYADATQNDVLCASKIMRHRVTG